jgi:hypothetical protein
MRRAALVDECQVQWYVRLSGVLGRARGRFPGPVMAVLGVLLLAGPVGLAASHPRRAPAAVPDRSLEEIARGAGCRLTEYDADPRSNPPVSGRVDERVWASDGSYVGRRSPSTLAAVHALLHGRVVFEFRPDLPAAQIGALDRLVRAPRAVPDTGVRQSHRDAGTGGRDRLPHAHDVPGRERADARGAGGLSGPPGELRTGLLAPVRGRRIESRTMRERRRDAPELKMAQRRPMTAACGLCPSRR